MENEQIHIVLIDEQQLFREGIRQILQTDPTFHILGMSNDMTTVTDLLETNVIHLLLIDKNIFYENKDEIKALIERYSPDLKVVILSTLSDENIIIEAIEIGVHGYLLKEMDISAFIQAIQMIHNDLIYIHPMINEVIVKNYKKSLNNHQQINELSPIQPPLHLLTKRESEVIQLLAQGKSNLAIAENLGISEKTVKNHISSIFKKINVNDRTTAVILAIRNRWVKI